MAASHCTAGGIWGEREEPPENDMTYKAATLDEQIDRSLHIYISLLRGRANRKKKAYFCEKQACKQAWRCTRWGGRGVQLLQMLRRMQVFEVFVF